jgi:hypothetical protein
VVSRRWGASKLGCLVTLLLAVAVAYFGVNAGEVYLRYYRFRDAMAQEARFAQRVSDEAIRGRLRSLADSLGLPEGAADVKIRRGANRVTIAPSTTKRWSCPLIR